jgi:tellurite resistance protein TehA-like permease
MTSASLLIVLIVGTAVGALTGLAVGSSLGALTVAILAGFLGTTIGAVVRNFILARGAGVGPDDSRTPLLVIIYALIASLAASAAAVELAQRSDLGDSRIWVGTLAGLMAAILMSMLMITYHTKPGEAPTIRSRR